MKLKVISTGSVGNAYILHNENEALLIECGVKIKEVKEALDFDLSKVVGCLMTHEHGDHANYVKDYLKLGIDVYSGTKTWMNILPDNSHNVKMVEHGETFDVGNFKVMPFDVKHDVPCLGFLIHHPDCGKVLFLTDTYYCKYTFDGLNNIIIEANYSKEIIDEKFGDQAHHEFLRNRILKSHFSLENCKGMLSANDLSAVNNIVLIHLSDRNSNEKQFVKEVSELTGKNVCAAVNGMEIPFNKTPF